MATTLNPEEEAQLKQTVEMFEVITQSQPQDYQSLEILKEAYTKLGRDKDAMGAAKLIAAAYVHMGQLSSAILEYETILQRFPDDAEAREALTKIESAAATVADDSGTQFAVAASPAGGRSGASGQGKQASGRPTGDINDGRHAMFKIFVEGKHITVADFDQCWPEADYSPMPADVADSFIQRLSDKAIQPVEKSLRLLVDKGRVGFLPLDRYDMDMELARSFPAAICRRWCVLPFDRMSKSVLVATANPFNQQAAKELAEATHQRIVWYVVPPVELVKNLRKVFRS